MTLSEFYALEVQCNEIMYFCNKVNEIKDAVEKRLCQVKCVKKFN